jgi:hypothetical protein
MSRRFGLAVLVAASMMIGYALNSPQHSTPMEFAPKANAADGDVNVAGQLDEIKVQVSEINRLLKSGTLKVVVVINPES